MMGALEEASILTNLHVRFAVVMKKQCHNMKSIVGVSLCQSDLSLPLPDTTSLVRIAKCCEPLREDFPVKVGL